MWELVVGVYECVNEREKTNHMMRETSRKISLLSTEMCVSFIRRINVSFLA